MIACGALSEQEADWQTHTERNHIIRRRFARRCLIRTMVEEVRGCVVEFLWKIVRESIVVFFAYCLGFEQIANMWNT